MAVDFIGEELTPGIVARQRRISLLEFDPRTRSTRFGLDVLIATVASIRRARKFLFFVNFFLFFSPPPSPPIKHYLKIVSSSL